MTILAVDAGRTHCRAAVFTDGDGGALVRGASTTRPSPATAVDPDGPARVAATIGEAAAELTAAGGFTVSVAAAGALRRTVAARLAAAIAEQVGAAREVVVANDVVAAHAAAFGGEPGVVLAVGTGAIALAVGPDRRYAIVDGCGYLVGDAGGGFAIGRAGLAAAMRHSDGRARGSAALGAAAVVRFGEPLAEVPYRLHEATDPARRVASFTPEVAAAARDGDPVAAAIWRDAVAELAETVLAGCATLGPVEPCQVALVGTLFELDDLLTAPLRAQLAERRPGTTVHIGSEDTLTGAARLVGSTSTYQPLVTHRKQDPAHF